MNRVAPLLMFDFDGVVADSLDVFHEHLAAACRTQGFGQIDERDAFLNLFDGNMVAGLRQLGMSAEMIAAVLADLGQRLASALRNCPPFPGIAEALRTLVQTVPVYIITSSLSSVVEDYLAHNGIAGVIEVLGADKEPSKVIKIQRLAAQFPDHQPVYIGDTLGDMREAHAAAAIAVGVAWGWHDTARILAGKPHEIIEKPLQLALLAKIPKES